MKKMLTLSMVLIPFGIRAVTFTGQQTGPTEWTYTLTFALLDNYSIFEENTMITLTNLFGVIGVAGPTSTDFPTSYIDQINTNWTGEVLNGGTVVRWTHSGPGTGNPTNTEQHVFGFRVFASGATNGLVSLTTSGFSRDISNPLANGTFNVDIVGLVAGPSGPGVDINQLVPCAGPLSGGTWKNHGQYLSIFAKTTEVFLAAGRITEEEAETIVEAAAHSDCGKK